MQNERSEEPGLNDLEAQLAGLVPRAEIDRDRLMFEAGARAARGNLLVVNRLLAASCVLLAATTIAPLVMRHRDEVVVREQPTVVETIPRPPLREEATGLPNGLAVADGRELAAAIADGHGDFRPARLRDEVHQADGGAIEGDAGVLPKPSRVLLREYLEAAGERL